MKTCKDCSKNIYYTSKRCKSCSVTKRNKSMSFRRAMSKKMKGRIITWDSFKGKKHTAETKLKMSKAQKGRIVSESHRRKISQTMKRKFRTGEIKLKNQIQKHHVDLDHNNNKKSNIMILTDSQHRKIHAWSYNYLVKINKVKDYVKWFKRKFL